MAMGDQQAHDIPLVGCASLILPYEVTFFLKRGTSKPYLSNVMTSQGR